jgi:hypothetical protein
MLLGADGSFAAPAPVPAPGGPAAPAGASAAPSYARHLAAAPVLYGHFTQQKSIQGIRKPLVSQGDFLVARGKGVIWRTRKPFAAAAAVTAKGLWALEGGDSARAPKRAPLHQGNLGATLGMMERVLSGDPAGLEKNFAVRASGGDSAWTLQLSPKDPAWGRFLRSIDVAGGAHIDSVAYLEANGDRTRISFTEVQAGAGALAAWSEAAFRD